MNDEMREFVLGIIDDLEEAERRIDEEWLGNPEDTDKKIADLKNELDDLLKKFADSN